VRDLIFAINVFHRTDFPNRVDGKAFLVRGFIDHYTVPVCVLERLQATAIHVVLANTPVNVVAAYLYPKRPLTVRGATNCVGEGCPLLMARDFKVKHRDSNSILKVAMFSLLCDYAYRNFCFVYEPDSTAKKATQ